MLPDPKYEEEVSGCTASVAIVSATKISVVSCRIRIDLRPRRFPTTPSLLTTNRPTLEIREPSLVSRDEQSLSRTITNRRMKVRPIHRSRMSLISE